MLLLGGDLKLAGVTAVNHSETLRCVSRLPLVGNRKSPYMAVATEEQRWTLKTTEPEGFVEVLATFVVVNHVCRLSTA